MVIQVHPAHDDADVPVVGVLVLEPSFRNPVHVRHHLAVDLQAPQRLTVVTDGAVIAAALDGDQGQDECQRDHGSWRLPRSAAVMLIGTTEPSSLRVTNSARR
jgi:hypothetical protein